MTIKEKKVFKHGGSLAIDLPKDFVKNAGQTVIIQYDENTIIIQNKTSLDNIESEPEFNVFVKALVEDALKHPERLKDINQVWDKEWDELLKDVRVDNDE
jgi:virulence-associated protein VagC